MTNFYRTGGGPWPPRPPGSATVHWLVGTPYLAVKASNDTKGVLVFLKILLSARGVLVFLNFCKMLLVARFCGNCAKQIFSILH